MHLASLSSPPAKQQHQIGCHLHACSSLPPSLSLCRQPAKRLVGCCFSPSSNYLVFWFFFFGCNFGKRCQAASADDPTGHAWLGWMTVELLLDPCLSCLTPRCHLFASYTAACHERQTGHHPSLLSPAQCPPSTRSKRSSPDRTPPRRSKRLRLTSSTRPSQHPTSSPPPLSPTRPSPCSSPPSKAIAKPRPSQSARSVGAPPGPARPKPGAPAQDALTVTHLGANSPSRLAPSLLAVDCSIRAKSYDQQSLLGRTRLSFARSVRH